MLPDSLSAHAETTITLETFHTRARVFLFALSRAAHSSGPPLLMRGYLPFPVLYPYSHRITSYLYPPPIGKYARHRCILTLYITLRTSWHDSTTRKHLKPFISVGRNIYFKQVDIIIFPRNEWRARMPEWFSKQTKNYEKKIFFFFQFLPDRSLNGSDDDDDIEWNAGDGIIIIIL